MLTKFVAEMTFCLACVWNIVFVALYRINEIGRRAGDVTSYTSLFVDREKSVGRGSLCHGNEKRTRLVTISVTTESSRHQGRKCLRVWP